MKTLFVAGFALLVLSLASPVLAAGGYLGGNSHIQLRHIMASVQKKQGSFMTEIRPLTPVMTVPKADDVSFVCQRAPRATEAILLYFQKNPAPVLRNRHVDTEALDKQHVKIAAYVNRALGRAAVSEVFIVEGAGARMATGAASRLPFAQIQGCSRVLEEFNQRMKKMRNGEEGK